MAEIFYKTDDNHYSSCKILSPSGKIASLVAVGAESGGTVRIKIANRQFSGNTFNYISNGTGTLSANSSGTIVANNDQKIYVTKVVGYK